MAMLCSCEKGIEDETDFKHDDDTEIVEDSDDDDYSGGEDDNPGKNEEGDIVDGNEDDDNSEFHTGDVVSVSTFLNYDISCQIWVQGYIVGACTRHIKNADFHAPFEYKSAILIADRQDETNTDNVVTIELKSGSKARQELNLVDNPQNFGRKVRIFGFQTTYLYTYGMKNIDGFELLD